MLTFLDETIQLEEAVFKVQKDFEEEMPEKERQKWHKKGHNKSTAMYGMAKDEKKAKKCVLCDGEHLESKCEKFKTKEQRAEKCRGLGLCFKCLESGHLSKSCPKQIKYVFLQKRRPQHTFLPKNISEKRKE